MGLKAKLKEWYRGKYIPPPEHEPDGSVTIPSPGWYQKPFWAKVTGSLFKFWCANWKWVIPTVIALIALWPLVPNNVRESFHTIPKASAGKFTVAVAFLDKDPDHVVHRQIVRGLEDSRYFQGIAPLPIEKTISLDGADREAATRAGHEKAREYVRKSGADLIIWGEVLGKDVARLFATGGDGGRFLDRSRLVGAL